MKQLMIVDGISFKPVHDVVSLPTHDTQGNKMPYVAQDNENHIVLGKIVKSAGKQSFPTGRDDGFGHPLYAKPIEVQAYVLSNMFYAKDGYGYLMKDGVCFRSIKKKFS